MLAEELAAADAKVGEQPAHRDLKRDGGAIVEDANEAKRQTGEADMSVSDMNKEQKRKFAAGWEL